MGTGRMIWRNPDAVPVDTLQFHLYLNAFKDNASTFMRERGGAPRSFVTDHGWGRIDITKLETMAGTNLLDRLFFLQPDDSNRNDATVARRGTARARAAGPNSDAGGSVHITATGNSGPYRVCNAA